MVYCRLFGFVFPADDKNKDVCLMFEAETSGKAVSHVHELCVGGLCVGGMCVGGLLHVYAYCGVAMISFSLLCLDDLFNP